MAKGIKTGGRQKGVSNRITKDVRLLLEDLVVKEINSIPAILNSSEPKDRLEFIAKLLPYVLPKYDQVSYSAQPPQRGGFFEMINQKIIESSRQAKMQNNAIGTPDKK